MNILEVNDLRKVYTTRFGGQSVEALRAVTFAVEEGEFVAVMGESGSGKTTLLNILAALDKPTSGQVLLEGKDIVKGKEADMAAFRRDHLGFVFQDFNLLDTFTLEDNIYLPLVLAGKKYPEMHRALLPLAEQLGIKELLKKYPYEVSGGQKQRAAVARAMITHPRILLADEPTGALDSHTGLQVHRRAAGSVCRTASGGPDHSDGDPLRQGGQPRRTGAVPEGRAGVLPAPPGKRHRHPVLPADLPRTDGADHRR